MKTAWNEINTGINATGTDRLSFAKGLLLVIDLKNTTNNLFNYHEYTTY